MKEHDATEIAFKNGYEKAVREIFEEIDELLCPYSSYIKTIDIQEYIKLKKKYGGITNNVLQR